MGEVGKNSCKNHTNLFELSSANWKKKCSSHTEHPMTLISAVISHVAKGGSLSRVTTKSGGKGWQRGLDRRSHSQAGGLISFPSTLEVSL